MPNPNPIPPEHLGLITKEQWDRAYEEGRELERARCAAIAQEGEKLNQRKLAEHLMFETDLTADVAVIILATAPAQAAKEDSDPTGFKAHMAKVSRIAPKAGTA